jgi:uncharacterized GH25 family protein
VTPSGKRALGAVAAILAAGALGYLVYLYVQPREEAPPSGRPHVETPTPAPIEAPPKKAPEPPQPVATAQADAPPPTGREGKPTEIAGFVRDLEGTPIAGATVQVIQYDTPRDLSLTPLWDRFVESTLLQTTTGPDGAYRFGDLVPAELKYVKAVAPGFIPQVKDAVKVGLLADFSLRPGAPVEIRVVDEATGEGLAGALVKGYFKTANTSDVNVTYRWDERRRTDAQGVIRFDAVPAEKILWLFHHGRYEDRQEEHAVQAGRTNVITLKMKRGLTVKGRVLNKFDDKPIPGAVAQISRALMPDKGLLTDEKGEFVFEGLTRGQQAFSFRADGFTEERFPYVLDDSYEFDSARNNVLEFRLEPTGSVSGVVLDPDGRPVDNARVYVAVNAIIVNKIRQDVEFVTRADGKFFVGNLGTKSAFFIAVHKDGYGIGVSPELKVGPAELREGLEVRLRRGSGIRGQVTNEIGAPIAGAIVTVQIPGFSDVWFPPGLGLGQASTQTFVTGDDGRYELTGVWKGSYTFAVEHPAHVGIANQRVEIREPDQVVTHDFTLKIGRFIAGRVTLPDGQPAEGATVTAYLGWSEHGVGTAATDKAGSYRIPGLVQGTYRVQARAEGLSSRALTGVPADSSNVDFRLEENGALAGLALSPDGAPVTSFTVGILPREATARGQPAPRGSSHPAQDEGGRFLIESVEPGLYDIVISAPAYARARVENVSIPSGSVIDIGAVRLPRGGTIRGRILTPSGQVPMDAMVTAFNISEPSRPDREKAAAAESKPEVSAEDGDAGGEKTSYEEKRQWSARPDGSGDYVLAGLHPGTYYLKVESPRHVVPPPEQVQVENDSEVVRDYTLPVSGQVVLTILDDFREPVVACLGTVREASTGRIVGTTGASPRSDSHGKLTLSGLPPGRLRVTLNRGGYIVKEIEIELAEGQTATQDVQLQKL